MFGDVPAPVGAISAEGATKGLAIQMTHNVHMETRCCRSPEGAVRALEHLLQGLSIVRLQLLSNLDGRNERLDIN